MKDKVAVLGMVERNGKLIARIVEDVQADTLTKYSTLNFYIKIKT